MSENTKSRLNPKLEVAFLYLKDFCKENDSSLKRKFIKSKSGNIIMICSSDNGTYASVGVSEEDDKLKIFMQDNKVKRWAELEGFGEDEMYEKLDKELIKEVSLMDLAKSLIA